MLDPRILRRLFDRHGTPVTVTDGPDTRLSLRAVVHPLRYKNKMYLQGAYTAVGYVDPGFYLYIGPGDVALDEMSRDATLTVGRRQFVIDRAERVDYRGKSLYCWAVLRTMIGEEAPA